MELKNNQITALSMKIYKELREVANKLNKDKQEKITKLIKTKLDLKANSQLKDFATYISPYDPYNNNDINSYIKSKYKSEFEVLNKIPHKEIVGQDQIRNEIILSTIDMKDVDSIIAVVKAKFK